MRCNVCLLLCVMGSRRPGAVQDNRCLFFSFVFSANFLPEHLSCPIRTRRSTALAQKCSRLARVNPIGEMGVFDGQSASAHFIAGNAEDPGLLRREVGDTPAVLHVPRISEQHSTRDSIRHCGRAQTQIAERCRDECRSLAREEKDVVQPRCVVDEGEGSTVGEGERGEPYGGEGE